MGEKGQAGQVAASTVDSGHFSSPVPDSLGGNDLLDQKLQNTDEARQKALDLLNNIERKESDSDDNIVNNIK